jgi:hypothetical protein
MHPSPARRLAVLRDPDRLRGMSGPTAAVAAGLAMTVWSFGTNLALSGFAGTPLVTYAQVVAGLLAGALLAATWGLAHWFRAGTRPPWGATLGLAVGAALGLRLGMDPATLAATQGVGNWSQLIFVPLAVAGAGGCMLALAAVLGGTATPPVRPLPGAAPAGSGPLPDSMVAGPRPVPDPAAARNRRWWPVAGLLGTVMFAGALWIGAGSAELHRIRASLGLAGPIDGLWQVGFSQAWVVPAAVAMAVLAVVVAVRLGRRRAGAVLDGGLIVGGAAFVVRWLIPTTEAGPYESAALDWWSAAAAGGTVMLVLLCRRGAAGLGEALLAAPVAALTVSAGVLLRYLRDWDDPAAAARVYFSRPLSMLALLTLAIALVAGLRTAREPPSGRRFWSAVAGTAGLAALVVLVLLLAGDQFLRPVR